MNLDQFAKKMEQRAADLPKAASKLAADVVEATISDLVQVTPIDEGTALSNWQVGIGAEPSGPIQAHDPGQKGSTKGTNAAETLKRAQSALAGKKPEEAVFLSDKVPYIERLNQGYSKQAPAGFVDRAVLIGKRVIAKAKVLK